MPLRDELKCRCGHTAYWHNAIGAPMGAGECEHDGDCRCRRFEPSAGVMSEAKRISDRLRRCGFTSSTAAQVVTVLRGESLDDSALESAVLHEVER